MRVRTPDVRQIICRPVCRALRLFACLCAAAAATAAADVPKPNPDSLRNGDLIFQTSRSGQSRAIQSATHSPYSHCGIVFFERGRPYVFEASTKVKRSPLLRFIRKGEGGKCVIRRLKGADTLLTPANLAKLEKAGKAFEGLPYDPYFGWSDEKIYCSELVYKIFRNALGLEIGRTARLREFDLSAPEVKRIMQQRYGDSVPLDEIVISPAAQFADTSLATVFDSYK
jgi:hypothetical protein